MHLSPKFCWEIYWSSGTNRESQAETGGHFQEEGQVLHQPLWNWGQSSCARPREQTLEYPKELRLILCFMDNMDPCSPHGSLPPPIKRILNPNPHQDHGPVHIQKLSAGFVPFSFLTHSSFTNSRDFAYILPNKGQNSYFLPTFIHIFCIFETSPNFVESHALIPPPIWPPLWVGGDRFPPCQNLYG